MASNKLRAHPAVKRSADGIMIQREALTVDPGWNVRVRDKDLEAHIDGIALSLVNGGTIPPIEIYINDDGDAVIVDGHCRNEALARAVELGAAIEWVHVKEFEGNDADRVAHMMTSAKGKGLGQYEQAEGFKRLKGFGWEIKEIAGRLGVTKGYVDRMLKLANADSEVKQLVKTGKVSAGAAVAVLRKEKGKTAKVLQAKVAKAQAKADKTTVDTGVVTAPAKITEKDVDDSVRLPKQLQADLSTFFTNLRDNMGALVYDEAASLVGMSPDALAGEDAEVGMTLLVSLIRIQQQLQAHAATQE
jgi:ParB family transcriptional regulator, chromosome partitioning protein